MRTGGSSSPVSHNNNDDDNNKRLLVAGRPQQQQQHQFIGTPTLITFSDCANNCVRRLCFSKATIRTLVGEREWGVADGHVDAARFNMPRGVALGPRGEIWVADSGNNTVRLVLSRRVAAQVPRGGRCAPRGARCIPRGAICARAP